MKTKHTLGPWKAEGLAIYAEPLWKTFGDGPSRRYERAVGKAYDNELLESNEANYRVRVNGIQGNNVRFAGREEAEANARLLAAAPELLEALLACVEPLEPGEACGLPVNVYNLACAAIAKAKGEA